MNFSRRHLPHLYAVGTPVFITFCLDDSFPPGRAFPKRAMTSGKAFACMDRLLDCARTGPMYLRMPEIARSVAESILRLGGLHAWVVMPNHVHLLITPQIEVPELMRRLKGSTAREANLLLRRTGMPFWQEESYDHLVRDSEESRRIQNYIVQNPVKAGLTQSPEEYLWSSAGLKSLAG